MRKTQFCFPLRCSILGRIPTREEYLEHTGVITKNADSIYRYMNFDKLKEFTDVVETAKA